MRGSRKLCQRGSNFDYFCCCCCCCCFLDDEGRKDPNTTISGPSSTHQRNAISMAFRWRADVGPTLSAGLVACVDFQGIRTSIAKKPYIFVIFQGGGSGPPVPHPGSAHEVSMILNARMSLFSWRVSDDIIRN